MLPVVTIITPVYQLYKEGRIEKFHRCITSVYAQTYKRIEHIVVDGASDDGTLDVLRQYSLEGKISYVSEKDNGIYEAMNKGVKMAKGEYILFLNSDDFFLTEYAVEKSLQVILDNYADFSYAKAIYRDGRGAVHMEIRQTHPDISDLFMFMPFCHQTMLANRRLFDIALFNEQHKSVSDYEWFLQIMLKGAKGIYLDEYLVEFSLGGMSDRISNRKMIKKETIEAYCNVLKPIVPYIKEDDCRQIMDDYCFGKGIWNLIQSKITVPIKPPSNRKREAMDRLYGYSDTIDRQEVILEVLYRYGLLLQHHGSVADKLSEIGYCSCAIYGFGRLGRLLYSDLKMQNFSVHYIIDRDPECKCESTQVKKPDDCLGQTDVIVVTAIYDFYEIKNYLERKIKADILPMDALL